MIGPHKRCAQDRFVIIGALIDALRRQERGKVARHANGVARIRLSLKDLEKRIEERRMRRACTKIEHKPLQPVGEEAHAGNRPCQFSTRRCSSASVSVRNDVVLTYSPWSGQSTGRQA